MKAIVFILATLTPFAASQTTDQFGTSHSPETPITQLTVVDFAASWCKPCLKSLPELQSLADAFPEIRFLVISEDETARGRDKLIQRTGITLPVVWDQDHVWAQHYSPEGMPALFVVDEKGTVIYSHSGFTPKEWQHFKNTLNRHTKADATSN